MCGLDDPLDGLHDPPKGLTGTLYNTLRAIKHF